MKFWKCRPMGANNSMRTPEIVLIAVCLTGVMAPGKAFCQQPDTLKTRPFTLVNSLEVRAKAITSDHLGNIYAIGENEIRKYTASGKPVASFSDRNAGTITSVDASNPLRIQVFYREFGQIVYLDDVLSIIGSPVSLTGLGLDQATLSCASWDDGIWLYDPRDFELKRLGSDLRISHQSRNINQLLRMEVDPNFIAEKNNYVYLNNPESGILVFDQYGTYFKTIPVKNTAGFQVGAGQVFYLENGQFMSYDFKSFQYARFAIPPDKESIRGLRFEKELKLLAVLREKKLQIFVIKD